MQEHKQRETLRALGDIIASGQWGEPGWVMAELLDRLVGDVDEIVKELGPEALRALRNAIERKCD